MNDLNASATTNSPASSERLATTIKAALRERSRREPDNLLYWTEANRVIRGKPMRIPPAMQAIYADRHRFIVVRKPSQVGATEFNINAALHMAATNYADRGVVLVVLPTQEMADRISQGRFAKAINESPSLRALAGKRPTALPEPSRVHRRAIGPGIIYFVGSESEAQYSGIDADAVFLDEYDLMQEGVVSLLGQRTRSSRAGRMIVTSTPTVEAFGISALYDVSDQRRYELRCAGCGGWETPEFPASVDWERLAVVCKDCRMVLDPWGQGRWIADNPSAAEIHGYQLNRLVLPNPPLEDMRLAHSGVLATTLEAFWRQDIGVPWVSEDARLSLADLEATTGWFPFDPKVFWFRRVVMGIDVGKKFHVVIRAYFEGRWLLLDAFTCDTLDELDHWMEKAQVSVAVIDSLPETRTATEFYRRHMGKVHLCRYANEGISPHWDWVDHTPYVRVPRTLAMDEWLYMHKSGQFAMRPDFREMAGGDYVAHLLAPVRVTEPDGFGQPIAVFKHTRPDDFAHAEVYAALATTRCHAGGVFTIDFEQMTTHSIDECGHPDLKYRHRRW